MTELRVRDLPTTDVSVHAMDDDEVEIGDDDDVVTAGAPSRVHATFEDADVKCGPPFGATHQR